MFSARVRLSTLVGSLLARLLLFCRHVRPCLLSCARRLRSRMPLGLARPPADGILILWTFGLHLSFDPFGMRIAACVL